MGRSVAIEGNTAVIGVPRKNVRGMSNAGEVHVLERIGTAWMPIARFSGGQEGARFGQAVSISGDRFVVGASRHSNDGISNGAVFTFEKNEDGKWISAGSNSFLYEDDLPVNAEFGRTLLLVGDRLAVASPLNDEKNDGSGAVYIYEFDLDEWRWDERLDGDGYEAGAGFGWSLASDGQLLAVGVPFADVSGSNSGAVSIFDFNTGSSRGMIVPSDANAHDRFGHGVAIQGDTVFVGAPFDTLEQDATRGTVYQYERQGLSNWTFERQLLAQDASNSDDFGHSLSLDGDKLLVGALRGNGSAIFTGSANLFRNRSTGWV